MTKHDRSDLELRRRLSSRSKREPARHLACIGLLSLSLSSRPSREFTVIMFEDELAHLDELEYDGSGEHTRSDHHQLINAPLLNLAALQQHLDYFPSRGILGTSDGERIYLNTNAPNSGVVCGVQVRLRYVGSQMITNIEI